MNITKTPQEIQAKLKSLKDRQKFYEKAVENGEKIKVSELIMSTRIENMRINRAEIAMIEWLTSEGNN